MFSLGFMWQRGVETSDDCPNLGHSRKLVGTEAIVSVTMLAPVQRGWMYYKVWICQIYLSQTFVYLSLTLCPVDPK